MENKGICGGFNEALKPYEESIRQAEYFNNLYERCDDISKCVDKLQIDYYDDDNNIGELDDYFTAIYESVRAFYDECSCMRAQGTEGIDELRESVAELRESVAELEQSVCEPNDWGTLLDFSDVHAKAFFIQRELAYMRAQRLEEAATQLLEKCESCERRGKGTTIPPREARKQRKREISQKRREAVNKRWSEARANAEASTLAESHKAANAVSVQVQNIVRKSDQTAATESERKALRKTYRPTPAQVAAFMHNALKVREDVAAEEAEKFLDYYDAIGWEFGNNAPVVSWEGVARSWVKKAERYQGWDIYEQQAPEPQAPKGEPDADIGIFDDDMIMKFTTKMLCNSFQGATGQGVWDMWEMILRNEFPKNPRGRAAWKIGVYFRDTLPKFLADKIRHGEGADPRLKEIRAMIEADNYTDDPLGYVARNVSRYLKDAAAPAPGA